MTSPLQPHLKWSRLAIGVLALSFPGWGQFTITASRQAKEVAQAPAGTIPDSLGMYSVLACNSGATTADLYPDYAVQEIAKLYPVQDGEAVVYAAARHKQSNWKVAGLAVLEVAVPAAAGFGAARAGTTIGKVVAGLGGGVGITQNISTRRQELVKLDVPAGWWIPGGVAVTLTSGQCHPMTLALGGKAPDKIVAEIGPARKVSQADPSKPSQIPVVELPAIKTHPQISEIDEIVAILQPEWEVETKRLEARIRERTAQVGAQ